MSQIEIETDVPVVMRDGTVLRADVYRPDGAGPWPVLVQRTPYGKSQVVNVLLLDVLASVKRGFIVVQQDTRGRFASDGEWLPWAYEHSDGYDTVEWAATIQGSNGKVGLFGGSYTGSTQWAAAAARPPHLAAIAPQITWSEPNDGLFARGGANEIGLNLSWSLVQSIRQVPKLTGPVEETREMLATTIRDFDEIADRTYWELPSGAMPALARTGLPDIGLERALQDPSTAESARVRGKHDLVQVPSLNIAGWYDVFQQGSIDNYVEMRRRGVPARLIIGAWRHMSVSGFPSAGQVGDVNFGLRSTQLPGSTSGTLTDVQLNWFDHWLRDEPATELHGSGVHIFVMGVNEWRAEEDWPLARAEDTSLYLHADGRLSFDLPGGESARSDFVYDPADPVPSIGGGMHISNEFPAGPRDQAPVEARRDVLVFTSDILDDDVEVTGRVRAALFASTDGPGTDWVVRLCDVDENGRSLNVVDGISRVEATPSTVAEHPVDLWSTSIVFRAGHRIRVHVTSSDFPRWDRNLNTGEPNGKATQLRVARQTVLHDRQHPSRLVIPVIPR